MKSIHVDWSGEDIYETWEFRGANLIREKEEESLEKCPHGNKDNGYCHDCEVYPDDRSSDNMPMMNYAYPLTHEPSDEKILEVSERTNCTVVFNNEDDTFYLALTGGGMNLSQDIALAYMICDGCIEWSMLGDVYITGALSVGKEDYLIILKELRRQLEISVERDKGRLKEVKGFIKKAIKGDIKQASLSKRREG